MRSRKRSSPAVEHPIDTPSLAFNHMHYTAGDFIDFKESVRKPWCKGRVKELGHHCLIIEPDDGSALVTIYPGKCGRVRQRHGGAAAQMPAYLDPEGRARASHRLEVDEVFARLEIDGIFVRPRPSEDGGEPGYDLPLVEPVRKDGSRLHAVPKPEPPARCPEYLAYVRRYPCCNCPDKGPSEPAEIQSEAHHQGRKGVSQTCGDFRVVPLCPRCHRVYTDTGALPGRDRAASLALMQETQVELLTRWAEKMSKGTANLVSMPMPRLVAACLALVFCLGMTACGETRQRDVLAGLQPLGAMGEHERAVDLRPGHGHPRDSQDSTLGNERIQGRLEGERFVPEGRTETDNEVRTKPWGSRSRSGGWAMRKSPTPAALSSPLGIFAILVGRCPGVRAHADLVAAQLQHGPATAADLQRAGADPKHLGLALALLREMGAVDVAPGEGRLVYQLADGLLAGNSTEGGRTTPEGAALRLAPAAPDPGYQAERRLGSRTEVGRG